MEEKVDDAWVQLRHDVCSLLSVADFRTITFVKSTKLLRQSTDPHVLREVIDGGARPVLHPDGRLVVLDERVLEEQRQRHAAASKR